MLLEYNLFDDYNTPNFYLQPSLTLIFQLRFGLSQTGAALLDYKADVSRLRKRLILSVVWVPGYHRCKQKSKMSNMSLFPELIHIALNHHGKSVAKIIRRFSRIFLSRFLEGYTSGFHQHLPFIRNARTTSFSTDLEFWPFCCLGMSGALPG